jgi:hypothetical protein
MITSFNDDLRASAVSLDWSLMTLEGMFHESVRQKSVRVDEQNRLHFIDLLHRFELVCVSVCVCLCESERERRREHMTPCVVKIVHGMCETDGGDALLNKLVTQIPRIHAGSRQISGSDSVPSTGRPLLPSRYLPFTHTAHRDQRPCGTGQSVASIGLEEVRQFEGSKDCGRDRGSLDHGIAVVRDDDACSHSPLARIRTMRSIRSSRANPPPRSPCIDGKAPILNGWSGS